MVMIEQGGIVEADLDAANESSDRHNQHHGNFTVTKWLPREEWLTNCDPLTINSKTRKGET